MKFKPQKYKLPDIPEQPFIDADEIHSFLENNQNPSRNRVEEIIQKSLNKERLNLEEVAALVNTNDPELVEMIKQGARTLKEKVYGKRIVLFAPLYVGNYCMNDCKYCGFRASNKEAQRHTLSKHELELNVQALEEHGQKRLILVYGEHNQYDPNYIADTVKTVYNVKKGNGEIRRVNINAAPLDKEGFKTVLDAGIGTYQVFQETYHPETYKYYHPKGRKADYNYRLTSLDRAQEVGLDDVGIGVLFGLYDWRFEVLSLVRHTNHLEACYNVGPHTISFPRLQEASDAEIKGDYLVNDEAFTKLVAILRLAVPYTGLILTAREDMKTRREVLSFGCSQIDAGTKLEIGAYAENPEEYQNLNKEQFQLADNRSLGEIIDELLEDDYLPSFCTACYRKGRTGEHFMEFSVPGFIKRYCTPNAIFTLVEYLEDYAKGDTYEKGYQVVNKNLAEIKDEKLLSKINERIERIKQGERDLYF